jgi:excisionase family DNA binding protein
VTARLEDLEAILTPAEVARTLKVHRQVVYNLIAGGRLRAVNLTGKRRPTWRILREDLISYVHGDVEQGRAPTPAVPPRPAPPRPAPQRAQARARAPA